MENGLVQKVEQLLKEENFIDIPDLLTPYLEKDIKAKELLGLCYLGEWKNEEAEGVFEDLKEKDPKNADYHYYYGASLGQQAKGANMLKIMQIAPKSKAAFERTLELDSQHIPAHWGLLRYYGNAPAMFGGYPKGKELADSLASFNEKEAQDAYNFLKEKFNQ